MPWRVAKRGECMRRLFILVWAALMLYIPVVAETASSWEGTWKTLTGESPVILEIAPDGTVTLTRDGQTEAGRLENQETGTGFRLGTETYTLRESDDFLILEHRTDLEVLVRDVYALPDTVAASDMSEFDGLWTADYVLVSGFRISLDAENMTISVRFASGKAELQLPELTESIVLESELRDGSLAIVTYDASDSPVYTLRKDGSMTREVNGMLFHFNRSVPAEGAQQ